MVTWGRCPDRMAIARLEALGAKRQEKTPYVSLSALLTASLCMGVCQATFFPMPSSGFLSGGGWSTQKLGLLSYMLYTIRFFASSSLTSSSDAPPSRAHLDSPPPPQATSSTDG